MKNATYLVLAAAVTLVGCGGDDLIQTEAPQTGWHSLMTAEWASTPGVSNYCARVSIDDDTYIKSIRPRTAEAVEHVTVSVGESTGPVGVVACDAQEANDTLLHATVADSHSFMLPESVALHAPAGSQLLVNVRMRLDYQVTEYGFVDLRVLTAAEDEVTTTAEAFMLGSADSDDCAMPHDSFLIGVSPQMPASAQMHLVAQSSFADDDVTLFDSAVHQRRPQLLDQPVPMRAGELVDVSYSDMASEEDCSIAVYRFPASSDGTWCAN